MIDLSDCLLLGTISKTHGIRGQVILRYNNLGFEDILKMESVFIEIDGLPVPFFIYEYTERNNESLVLTLEDVISENQAKLLVEKRVFVKSSSVKKSKILLNQPASYLGYKVIDKKYGDIGILEEVLEIHNNPLYKIRDGKKEILIPIHPEFILHIDIKQKTILVNTPPGLTGVFD